ncbi:MAG: ABC transporter ATP-binding protein [Burkholderiales bacterium]|nr:ABC transporter ATP-binding protein [Burkholderiales bacterium]
MKLFLAFSRIYPKQSALALGSLLLASLIEGFGLVTMLPLLATQSPDMATRLPKGLTRAVQQALDFVGLAPTVGLLLLIIVTVITLKCVLVLLANRQVGFTVALVSTDFRLEFIRSLLSARWEYYLRQPIGALANSVTGEVGRATMAYLHSIKIIALVAQTVVYTGIAMIVSVQATLGALAIGAVVIYLLNRFVHISRRAGVKQSRLARSFLVRLADNMQSIKPLKAMARENLAATLLESDTAKMKRTAQKDIISGEVLRALQEPTFTILIAAGLYVALVHFGMSFASVLVLAYLLLRVLSYLGRIQREYQRLAACEGGYWLIRAEIDRALKESESPHAGITPVLRRSIRFDNVGFRYKDHWVLRNAALTIPAGGITAIVGSSGAGKTTVIDLVTALLQPQEGEIWIDDVPLRKIDWRAWRRMIGYVPQDTVLLHDSVKRNVTLGDPELNDADAEAALRAAGIWDFVSRLPEGMDAVVGERGGMLSGGQRQRIAIARALAHRPRLLILDEATNALDAKTEAAICRTLEGLRGDLTIIAVSHQSPLVEVADRVYRISGGSAELETDRSLLASA